MIFQQIKEKPFEYLSLLLVLLAGVVLFLVFNDSYIKRGVIYGLSAAYFAWSLYHHYRRGDLHVSIIVEYLLIVLLAIILISSTLI